MKIIAIEGPSYAGKSTAIHHLRTCGIEEQAFVSDCYVQHIHHRNDIPPAHTGSAAEQLAAFETFMRVENARVHKAHALAKPLVILDRSVDTLLAHAHALDSMLRRSTPTRWLKRHSSSFTKRRTSMYRRADWLSLAHPEIQSKGSPKREGNMALRPLL